MKTRRILISGGLAVGGPQTHITILCRVLREAGADVTIAAASTNWPPEAIAGLRALGVRVVVSPFGFGPWRFLGKVCAFLAWPFLLRRDYDVLYCSGEGRMHLWASRFLAPGAWKIYHELVECPRPGSVGAQVAARMDSIIATSGKIRGQIARLLPGARVCAVPCLMSSASLPPPAPRDSVLARPLRMVFLGRLVPHKQPDRLIQAWSSWNQRAPIAPAQLDLYGGDHDQMGDRLREQISGFGLEKSVRLRGAYAIHELPQIFAETDMVVLPSLYEGLPTVLVEAMHRGVPVVATSAGGTEELGENNPDVIITEGTDWDKFASGVEAMAHRVRAGEIDRTRLYEWTESRYGFLPVAQAWREVFFTPEFFFAQAGSRAVLFSTGVATEPSASPSALRAAGSKEVT